MAEPVQINDDPACPRCATPHAAVVARSPIQGVWQMHLCTTCFYSWRNTEPDYATRTDALAAGFHIDPANIPLGKPMPTVPPLRSDN